MKKNLLLKIKKINLTIISNLPLFLAILTIIVTFFLNQYNLWIRYIDPDEFEHIHATYCIYSGMIPHIDFFEVHPPLLWYLLLPFF